MSAYGDYDEPRRYRTTRTRPRERDEPDYVREETYIERGKGAGPRELVFRGRDDSVEDIQRDFPPPSGRDRLRPNDDYGAPRRARSARGRYDDDYDDDRYTDYGGPAAAGAAAGYAAGRRDKDRRRRRPVRDDRDYDSEYSDSPPRRDRRKSGVGEVLEGLGLGGLAGAVLGNKNKDKDRGRDRSDDRSVRSRSRRGSSRGRGRDDSSSDEGGGQNKTGRKWAQAAQAALIAGAVEAFRARNEPGPWTGDKGKRIATAAIGAGGIDRILDKNPDQKSKRHLAEAVIGGLAATRLANGARSKSRGGDRGESPDSYLSGRTGRTGRSRSIVDRFRGRSQSRGRPDGAQGGGGGGGNGIKELVAGGALAAAGKAIYDRVRSKSRNNRRRSRSGSADSYVPSRNRRRDLRRRSPPSGMSNTRRNPRGTDRGLGDRDTNGNNDRAIAAGAGGGAAAYAAANQGDNGSQRGGSQRGGSQRGGGEREGGGEGKKEDHGNSSDSSSTTSMENKRKKMRGKELLTAGLATIATIHAAHGVYSSMEAHEKRHRLVAEGEMSPEEARKKQTKAWVQDAAAVGIAALGIKGAFSEWKEMNEQRCVHCFPFLHDRLQTLADFLPQTDARSTGSRSASENAARRWSTRRKRKKERTANA